MMDSFVDPQVSDQLETDQPATAQELSEYRRIRPLLLEIIEDWQTLRGARGCPAMSHILRK